MSRTLFSNVLWHNGRFALCSDSAEYALVITCNISDEEAQQRMLDRCSGHG